MRRNALRSLSPYDNQRQWPTYAAHPHRHCCALTGDGGVFQFGVVARHREIHLIVFKKQTHHFAAVREFHVLRQVAGTLGDFQRVELGDHHSDDVAGLIEYRSAALPCWMVCFYCVKRRLRLAATSSIRSDRRLPIGFGVDCDSTNRECAVIFADTGDACWYTLGCYTVLLWAELLTVDICRHSTLI